MTVWPVSFVRIDQEVRGPFTPEQLRALAERGLITLETEAAAGAAGPWMKFCESQVGVDFFANRPGSEFKPEGFERVNQRGGTPVDHRELIAAANRPPPPAAGSPAPPATTPNQIFEILQLNREHEMRAGLHQLSVQPPRSNRRRFDYWILMAVGNGFFGSTLCLGWSNAPVMVYSISGMVIFTAGVTWVMYGVMDRY